VELEQVQHPLSYSANHCPLPQSQQQARRPHLLQPEKQALSLEEHQQNGLDRNSLQYRVTRRKKHSAQT